MRVKRAKKIGFCFGVRRAINMAEAALGSKQPIYSLGSIIHNKQVVDALAMKGLKVVSGIDKIRKGMIVISSHGLSPRIKARIVRKGMRIIDTTCPFVLKAQNIARSLGQQGYKVIIVGERQHPEIKALVDFVPGKAMVVKDKREARSLRLKEGEMISVISQTTQATDNFLDVVKIIIDKRPKELRVFNTICKDAEERQGAARRLAKEVDVMLIAGGKNSANTRRLYEVCRQALSSSHLIETESDIDHGWLKGATVIGITSGASTPDWVIKKVVKSVRKG